MDSDWHTRIGRGKRRYGRFALHTPRIVRPTRAMRLTTTFLLLLMVCAGCRTPAGPTQVELRERLKTVTLADGVSQSEARIIGECYFAWNVGCGAFYGIRDGGDRWIVDGGFGYAAEPVKGFYIDKHSGKVVSPIGPSYDNPLEIFP
jgi:hypothetical protein